MGLEGRQTNTGYKVTMTFYTIKLLYRHMELNNKSI